MHLYQENLFSTILGNISILNFLSLSGEKLHSHCHCEDEKSSEDKDEEEEEKKVKECVTDKKFANALIFDEMNNEKDMNN